MSEVTPPPPPAVPPTPPPPGAAPQQGKGKAVAALVLGIVSVALCLYWFISVPAGIIAIVLGLQARKQGIAPGMALGGLITGVIGTVFGLLLLILGLAGGGLDGYCDDNPDSPFCTTQ